MKLSSRTLRLARPLIVATVAALTAAAIYWPPDARDAPSDHPATSPSVSAPSPDVGVTATDPSLAPDAASSIPATTSPVHTRPDTASLLTDLERALAEVRPGDREALERLLADKLPALVAHDPEAAARFAELQTDALVREQLVRQIAQLWATRDTDAAIAWTESLPVSPIRDVALIDLALGVARGDPARAVHWRERSVGDTEADGVLGGLVAQWADRDFDAAIAWTTARPRTVQRDLILHRLVYVRAASGQPEAAARLADEAFIDRAQKADAMATIAHQWALRDRDAATRWAQSLDPLLSARALREIDAADATGPN